MLSVYTSITKYRYSAHVAWHLVRLSLIENICFAMGKVPEYTECNAEIKYICSTHIVLYSSEYVGSASNFKFVQGYQWIHTGTYVLSDSICGVKDRLHIPTHTHT